MPLEEFINQVGYYLNNPDAEPLFAVVPDEKLREMGVEVPTAEAVEANVRATVAAIQVGEQRSGFEPAKKNTVEISTVAGRALAPAPPEAPEQVDPALQDAIKKARLPSKG